MCSYCGQRCRGRYDKQVCRVRDLSLAGWRIYLEYERWRVNCSGCGGVHVEHLDWLANNSRYTQRFATHVGRLCRDMPNNKAVAEMERLHHGTVKALDTLYMQEQVDRAGLPAPRAIGVDEISIRKGHNYRVIVSDLERARPIWVGGEGRKETDIDLFFKALGGKKSARIKLAAMDMWKPFRNSVIHNAPNARIIFDKCHIMRHLSKALDEVRRGEYKRLSGKDRSYIKGQRYTLLSRRENLSLDGRRALKKLLQANRRLNTAYILKEAFGQLWDYRTERGARAFFTRWKDSLKWQRLHPYQKFESGDSAARLFPAYSLTARAIARRRRSSPVPRPSSEGVVPNRSTNRPPVDKERESISLRVSSFQLHKRCFPTMRRSVRRSSGSSAI